SAAVYAFLARLGGEDVLDILNGNDINRLDNIITLCRYLHEPFDKLQMYLTAIKVWVYNCRDHTYAVETLFDKMLSHIPENPVTFTTDDPENFPLPSPFLLALHRACARVAHFSGAFYQDDD
ncbi:uncharacterized protein EV420DRAFT_1275047, partial [Desarmillaria tabescens]